MQGLTSRPKKELWEMETVPLILQPERCCGRKGERKKRKHSNDDDNISVGNLLKVIFLSKKMKWKWVSTWVGGPIHTGSFTP